MKSSQKYAEFGKKLDYLEGILGAQLPTLYFSKSYQADWIDTLPTQFSRKRKGAEAISNRELSKFIDLFQIGKHLDFRLFQMDFDTFVTTLANNNIGTHAGPKTQLERQVLLSIRDNNYPVAICRASAYRAGGIGGDTMESEVPQFRIHDRVYLHVPILGEGHLMILNDHTAYSDLTCLMPSRFAPETNVRGNSIRVPTEQQSLPYFQIAGPKGFYRLFAIWTKEPILSRFSDLSVLENSPTNFSSMNFKILCTLIKNREPQKLTVMTGDYWVN